MKTLKAIDIFNYATLTGKRFEASTQIWDSIRRERIQGNSYIGIELKKHVWFWWKLFRGERDLETRGIKNNLNDSLFFDHRYNQMNGAIQKSSCKGRNAEKIILAYLSQELEKSKDYFLHIRG